MLFTLEPNDRIMIGDDVAIDMLEMVNSQAKFGIDAPEDKQVHREEIYLKILKERKAKKAG